MAPRPHCRPALTALAVALSSGSLLAAASWIQPAQAGTAATTPDKGAQVYCYMRANGNAHEVSWSAAYALIKRQSAGVFKTSPEHGAVMITEAVVQNPAAYPDCGRFLGDLYIKREQSSPTSLETKPNQQGLDGSATLNNSLTGNGRPGY